ncbi:MAG: Maf family protein [Chloroflexota bacterium]
MSSPGSDSLPFILASNSPRRREILAALGVPFVVRASEVPESPLPGETAEYTVRRLAEAKAREVTVAARERFVIGADTVVVCDGASLGKPANATEARAMLASLRGRRHEVTSGIAVVDTRSGNASVGTHTTAVWMREYSRAEVERYIASGDPFDKAGAYAIQDPAFHPVACIEGCYLNVVGLPLCLLLALLWEAGAPIPPPDPARVSTLCRDCVLVPF